MESFQLQNAKLEECSEQECLLVVRAHLEIIGFKLTADSTITIIDFMLTRRSKRCLIEFSVDRETAQLMRAQRNGRKEQLEKWNRDMFGENISFYVVLKSVENYLCEPTTSLRMNGIDTQNQEDLASSPEQRVLENPLELSETAEDINIECQEETEDRTEVLNKFPFHFRIQSVPVDLGMMKEVAVTQFFVRLGFPDTVPYEIVNFTEHASTSESPRFDAEIAVTKEVHEKLLSANVRLALLLLNEQKSLKDTSDYIILTSLSNRRDKAIQEVLEGVCALLRAGKSLEEFNAIVKNKSIVIHEFQKPTRTLTIEEVYQFHCDEYMEIVMNCSDEVYNEMKSWLEEEVAKKKTGIPRQDVQISPAVVPSVLPKTPGGMAMEIMNRICDQLNRGKLKSEWNAVARNNVIMIHKMKQPTVIVKIMNVPNTFPSQFETVMKTYKDEEYVKRMWTAAQELEVEAGVTRKKALDQIMVAFCAQLNEGKDKAQLNAFVRNGKINIAKFQKKNEIYSLEEAVRRMPDIYKNVKKNCDKMFQSEVTKWEATKGLKRAIDDKIEGPEPKMTK